MLAQILFSEVRFKIDVRETLMTVQVYSISQLILKLYFMDTLILKAQLLLALALAVSCLPVGDQGAVVVGFHHLWLHLPTVALVVVLWKSAAS